MEWLAYRVIRAAKRELSEFTIGYHAKPTMHRLHLHVISRDFHSPWLKSTKSWNSFNTQLFLSTERKLPGIKWNLEFEFIFIFVYSSHHLIHADVINQLTQMGSVWRLRDQVIQRFLGAPLKCNQCAAQFRNIPGLKEHLARHYSNIHRRWPVFFLPLNNTVVTGFCESESVDSEKEKSFIMKLCPSSLVSLTSFLFDKK